MRSHRFFLFGAVCEIITVVLAFAPNANAMAAAVQPQPNAAVASVQTARAATIRTGRAAAGETASAAAGKTETVEIGGTSTVAAKGEVVKTALVEAASGSVSLQLGLGVGEQYLRVAANYEMPSLWTAQLGFLGRVDLSLEAGLAFWGNTRGSVHDDELYQLTLLPLLRWWVCESFFIEGGVGPSVFNRHHFAGKNISTDFQFADHIGGGVRLADSLRLSVRYAHFSNGGIRRPNPGLNVIMVSLAYEF